MITIKFFKFSDCQALSPLILTGSREYSHGEFNTIFLYVQFFGNFFYIALSLTTFPFNRDRKKKRGHRASFCYKMLRPQAFSFWIFQGHPTGIFGKISVRKTI